MQIKLVEFGNDNRKTNYSTTGFVWKQQPLIVSFVSLPQSGEYRYTSRILYENSQPVMGSPRDQ